MVGAALVVAAGGVDIPAAVGIPSVVVERDVEILPEHRASCLLPVGVVALAVICLAFENRDPSPVSSQTVRLAVYVPYKVYILFNLIL